MPETSMEGDKHVSAAQKFLMTLLLLAAGYYIAARFGDLSMRPGQPMSMPEMDMPGMRH